MNYGLEKKIALITGGSHGIGLATAIELGRQGCKVAICSRTQDRLNKAKEILINEKIDCLTIPFDAFIKTDPKKVVSYIQESWGTIDILVNNVGGGGRWGKEIVEETELNVWDEVMQKNALNAAYFTSLCIPLMRKKKWGRVINITSIYGKEGGGRPWFCMAKAAEAAMMTSLSRIKHLVRDGITFNSVAPGYVYIDNTGFEDEKKNNLSEFNKKIDLNLPLGRLGSPEEIASVVCFLSSNKASLINGEQISVDGGQSSSI